MSTYDAVIIGAGHNGLVTAAYLGKAGRNVLVLERRGQIGGLCAADAFGPGHEFTMPGLLHDTDALSAEVFDGLDLASHGLARTDATPVLALGPDGQRFDIAGADHEAWIAAVDEHRRFIRRTAHQPAPNLHPENFADFAALGRAGLRLRRLGRESMIEFMRVAPMSAADWLNEYFDEPAMAEAVLMPALIGTQLGPWSSGTAMNLLLHECLRVRPVIGGAAALAEALEAACMQFGAEIHTNAAVSRIVIEDGVVKGVVLKDGSRVTTSVVASAADPKSTLLDLIEPAYLDAGVEKQFQNVRARGTAAKLNLAVRGEPVFGEASRVRMIAGSLNDMERAFDAAKYGECSARPVLDIAVVAAAPAGHHLLSVLAGYAPYQLRAGWSDETDAAFTDLIIDRIGEHIPDIRSRIVAQEFLSPVDIEARYGVSEGQIHHVEPALDQMMAMRPTITSSRHATPIAGLYLCGSGTHPTGGISGLPGMLAAKAIDQA